MSSSVFSKFMHSMSRSFKNVDSMLVSMEVSQCYCSNPLIFIESSSMPFVHLYYLHLHSESWIEKTGYTEDADTYA